MKKERESREDPHLKQKRKQNTEGSLFQCLDIPLSLVIK